MSRKDRELLTTSQAAKLCAVKPDTVRKWIRRGRIKTVRTAGGHYRIHIEELEPYLAGAGADTCVSNRQLRCWEYLAVQGVVRSACQRCEVYESRTSWCFAMQHPGDTGHGMGGLCPRSCQDCLYYRRVMGHRLGVLVVSTDAGMLRAPDNSVDLGLELRFASNAYQTSALIQSFKPAFVLLDHDLLLEEEPGLLASLSGDPRVPGLKIILAISASVLSEINGNDKYALVDAKIVKPLGLGDLSDLLLRFPVGRQRPGTCPVSPSKATKEP